MITDELFQDGYVKQVWEKSFFSSANSDHLVVAWSIFENSKIASGIRENCPSQIAMSAMGMHDLVPIYNQIIISYSTKRKKD